MYIVMLTSKLLFMTAWTRLVFQSVTSVLGIAGRHLHVWRFQGHSGIVCQLFKLFGSS